jgi:dimethylargininase
MFNRAIVRAPSENFADGLTSVDLGVPDFDKALVQHRAYCEALVRCGLELTELEPDARYPDSTFVEDTAVLTENPRGDHAAWSGEQERRDPQHCKNTC